MPNGPAKRMNFGHFASSDERLDNRAGDPKLE